MSFDEEGNVRMNDVRGGGYFCTKKLYKSCTTVSRGGTIPLSMRFLSIRRSSIPVCGSRNENKGYTKGGKVQENQGFPHFFPL